MDGFYESTLYVNATLGCYSSSYRATSVGLACTPRENFVDGLLSVNSRSLYVHFVFLVDKSLSRGSLDVHAKWAGVRVSETLF